MTIDNKFSNKMAFSIAEVQAICGLGRTRLYELIKSNVLLAKKLGKRTLILRSDLDAFLSNLPSYTEQDHEEGVQ